MAAFDDLISLIDAFDEPILLVSRGSVAAANAAARAALGPIVQGSDVRLAIRHPAALERILSGRRSDVEVTGLGAADRPWMVAVRPLGGQSVLVRLIDRSATRAAEKMRVDFVANASHELRTPLSTVLGYAETLAEDDSLDQETRARFGKIVSAEAKRMLRIVEDLMSLSRIQADRFVAPTGQVRLAEVLDTVYADARALAERRHCTLELEVASDLPPVRGDFAQLAQMTDNLVSNAIRYGCGKRGCTVRIEARPERDGALLTVTDDGEGIAAQHLPRLTERFYRVDEARSRDSGGTGLGLAIVKHIVERHRGTIEIRSAPGRGTKVLIWLPSA